MKSVLIALSVSLMISVPMFFINRNLEHSQVNALMSFLLLIILFVFALLLFDYLKAMREAHAIINLLTAIKTGDVYERQEENGTEAFVITFISREIEKDVKPLTIRYLNCTGAYQGLNDVIGTICPNTLLTEYEYLGNLNGKTPIFENSKTE